MDGTQSPPPGSALAVIEHEKLETMTQNNSNCVRNLNAKTVHLYADAKCIYARIYSSNTKFMEG